MKSAQQLALSFAPNLLFFSIELSHIGIVIEPIDGPGGVLGSGQPLTARNSEPRLPTIGIMRFDTDDVQTLIDNGTFEDVIVRTFSC